MILHQQCPSFMVSPGGEQPPGGWHFTSTRSGNEPPIGAWWPQLIHCLADSVVMERKMGMKTGPGHIKVPTSPIQEVNIPIDICILHYFTLLSVQTCSNGLMM